MLFHCHHLYLQGISSLHHTLIRQELSFTTLFSSATATANALCSVNFPLLGSVCFRWSICRRELAFLTGMQRQDYTMLQCVCMWGAAFIRTDSLLYCPLSIIAAFTRVQLCLLSEDWHSCAPSELTFPHWNLTEYPTTLADCL